MGFEEPKSKKAGGTPAVQKTSDNSTQNYLYT
jgi:hypothetical protein